MSVKALRSPSQVAWRNTEGRPESLNEVAALRMGLKFKQLDKLSGSWMHDASLMRHKIGNRTSEKRRSAPVEPRRADTILKRTVAWPPASLMHPKPECITRRSGPVPR